MNIYAHRGNSGFFPENTMYAFKKSLDLDICGIELDVQKTKDGILVVHHDETLGRVFDGKGYIKKLTFDQLVDSNLNNDELISRDDCKIPTLEEVLELIKPTNLTINIEIKNVDFSYDKERKVLKNVNVTIPKGKMIALVGESGCGKSTITNLLLKQEKVDSGEITLNGIDLNYIPFEVLTKKVGFINHSAYIFNGTIEDNLRMGKFDANEREINEALKKANLYDFVQSLPEKLQTNVGEGGSLLSGGQKQRLALARTIITNPEIYIFDEATSNIDVESEEKIWRSIYELSENKTVIVISHRLANVKNADNIYVLDKGNIVESGSHKDLMMYNGKYAQLVNHQNNLESIYNDELIQKEVAISE